MVSSLSEQGPSGSSKAAVVVNSSGRAGRVWTREARAARGEAPHGLLRVNVRLRMWDLLLRQDRAGEAQPRRLAEHLAHGHRAAARSRGYTPRP